MQGQAFSVLVDGLASTTYTATGLTSGTTYEFKVEARNQYDFSAYSATLALLAAHVPEVATSVATTIDGSSVKVSWTLPSTNGSPITLDKVFLQNAA